MILRDRPILHFLTLLLIGVAVFLPDLGLERGIDEREARHAEIAREMAETGNWAVPYVCGKPYTDKPPLFNWTVALLFRLTGRVDFTIARLPSALAAIAAMFGIYLLGRRWFTPRAGMWAAIMWATSWLVLEWGRGCRMDMMMASLILWGIVLADYSAASERQGVALLLWGAASAAVGAAALAKNLVAVFFFAVAVVPLWRARRGRWVPPLRFILVTLLLLTGVVGGWAVLAEASHPGYIREMGGYQFGEGLWEHPKRLYLYFDQILVQTAPWSLFSVGAAYAAIRRIRRRGYDRTAIPGLTLAVSLVVMTLIPNKREHFLLPILPMWALFLAGFMDQALAGATSAEASSESGSSAGEERFSPWLFERPILFVLIALAALMAVGTMFWAARANTVDALAIVFAALAAAFCTDGALAALRGRWEYAARALLLSGVVLAVAAHPVVIRGYARPLMNSERVSEIRDSILPGLPVAAFDMSWEYLYFKLNRPVAFVEDPAQLTAFLAKPGPLYVITTPERAADVRRLTSRAADWVRTWTLPENPAVQVTVLAMAPG